MASYCYEIKVCLKTAGFIKDEEEDDEENTISRGDRKQLLRTLVDNIGKGCPSDDQMYYDSIIFHFRIYNVQDTFKTWINAFTDYVEKSIPWNDSNKTFGRRQNSQGKGGLTAAINPSNNSGPNKLHQSKGNHNQGNGNTPLAQPICTGCGNKHAGACMLTHHPDYNKDQCPWADSKKGKLWKSLGHDH